MSPTKPTAKVFSDEERAAMQERAKEQKAAARRGAKADQGDIEAEVLAKIAEMGHADRALAERIHAVIKERAPGMPARLWYGMPAYAGKGKTVCFFQPGTKFKTRYSTLGFNDPAKLDDGTMWPV